MRYKSFKEFWPFYVREHSKAATRWVHFVGTSIGFWCLVGAVMYKDWRLVLAGLFAGYLCAWVAHFAIEHNRPATFKYPLWSFFGDWKMWAFMMLGRMDEEVQKYEA